MPWHNHWPKILLAIVIGPLIAVGSFAVWISVAGAPTEDAIKAWDTFVKLLSALTVVFTSAALFAKYTEEQREARKSRERLADQQLNLKRAEFLKQKWTFDNERHQRKRLLFQEAATLAARLSTMASLDSNSLQRFDELYYAELIGVEKSRGEVEKAMVAYRERLYADDGKDLSILALCLANACKEELAQSEEKLLQQYKDIVSLKLEPITEGSSG